ncbi:MAG TPA: hypothetical protein VM238_21635 [Phycisphaerae bacterium]|nr:hypothetical protein [Phycisphaerae bacterium]
MAEQELIRAEAVAAWRKAQAAHADLKAKQKAARKALNAKHSDELKASRGIIAKARKVAERLALAEVAAEADADKE